MVLIFWVKQSYKDMDLLIFLVKMECKLKLLFSYNKKIHLYKPKPLSWITGIIGYITNKLPQFINYEKSVS